MLRDKDVDVPISISMSGVTQFQSNESFRKRDLLHESDKKLQRRKKAWIVPKGDPRRNRESLTTLLTVYDGECSEYIEKLLDADISYQDLASLTHKDLELIGFRNYKQRQELLNLFAKLPNQDISYDSISKLPEASSYNPEIFNLMSAQIESMRYAISAANYKLMKMPPDDVIVGEKRFASCFLLEALNELRGLTDEITKKLKELEPFNEDVTTHQRNLSKNPVEPVTGKCIIFASVLAGSLAALWLWKLNK